MDERILGKSANSAKAIRYANVSYANIEDLLLGKAEATPEMLAELAALQDAPQLSEEELARQALAHGGADNDPATPE